MRLPIIAALKKQPDLCYQQKGKKRGEKGDDDNDNVRKPLTSYVKVEGDHLVHVLCGPQASAVGGGYTKIIPDIVEEISGVSLVPNEAGLLPSGARPIALVSSPPWGASVVGVEEAHDVPLSVNDIAQMAQFMQKARLGNARSVIALHIPLKQVHTYDKRFAEAGFTLSHLISMSGKNNGRLIMNADGSQRNNGSTLLC